MKAIIKLDVPDFQIGQEVTVYFKDTMMKKGVCETDDVVRCKDCKHYDSDTQSCLDGLDGIFQPDWYCADGERKDGDDGGQR